MHVLDRKVQYTLANLLGPLLLVDTLKRQHGRDGMIRPSYLTKPAMANGLVARDLDSQAISHTFLTIVVSGMAW